MTQATKRCPSSGHSDPATSAAEACLAAQQALGPDLVIIAPVDQSFIDVNWSETCWAAPSCVVRPTSAQLLATVLRIIVQFQVLFAIRSGGHSPNPGWASIGEPGVLLDLSRLDTITVSDDASVVSVGPGQRWGGVVEALDSHNVTAVAGRLTSLGVGGLLLGGGFSFFSGEYGLAADNVRSVELVLGNGTVVEASAQENPDLFWALKGGGPNYGIVTRFDLFTIPIQKVYAEVVFYAPADTPTFLRALADWQLKAAASDPRATVIAVSTLGGTTAGFIYSQPVTARPDIFAAFSDIPVLAAALPPTNLSPLELMEVSAGQVGWTANRHDYRGVSTQIDGDLYVDMYNFWAERAADVYSKTGANQTFVIQPITVNLAKQSADKGGNALGMAPSSSMSWWTTLIDWENAADDDVVRSVSIATTEEWKKRSTVELLYMNDCSRDQDPLRSYGAENVAKLCEVSHKYDPGQVFQKLQHDGFLLRKLGVC
ncbi:hypothetical protein CHGG_08440 [Chaetomium globosum CBS 148.51]|uniref:FAD-binding PCMH-type domain-containing protein n=1 Tax=Chaetomium globosum (strain ATCC 6205 / CBS 148.51 / DSM 1962 / NBRC 6347 / NRRL 1970) TaxID=306901 RepID=Q2GUB4_CHAGB|nr:uncharacterized protein CHGG_08440 [Chaetomium globosum CBS 148.51]EAQ84426.1 hypothetical protein CHGG_08440 [Chaetomium globosum CBS 148.51]